MVINFSICLWRLSLFDFYITHLTASFAKLVSVPVSICDPSQYGRCKYVTIKLLTQHLPRTVKLREIDHSGRADYINRLSCDRMSPDYSCPTHRRSPPNFSPSIPALWSFSRTTHSKPSNDTRNSKPRVCSELTFNIIRESKLVPSRPRLLLRSKGLTYTGSSN